MSIADDIRPKKFKRISKHSSRVSVKVAKERDEIEDKLFSRPDTDGFFANTPIEKNGKTKKGNRIPAKIEVDRSTSSHNYRWLYTLTIIIVILILAGLVAWQNLDTIKSFVNGSYKKKNDQSLNEIISSTNDSLKKYDTSGQKATDQSTTDQQNIKTIPAIDKSVIKISVLNGSGVKNSAKAVADTLTAAGFTVTGTGNARSFSYQTTYIYYKSGKDVEANLVKSAISDKTTEIKESNTVVGSTNDIVVVVGKT